MLKEGWDVTNLYTIVPLRAASARVLIEQTIGRGLRLPYGKRTGVAAVDRLSIVAHDRFQEIVDAANQPDSIIKLHSLVISDADLAQKPRVVVANPLIESRLGITPEHLTDATVDAGSEVAQAFTDPGEQEIARITYTAIRSLQRDPVFAPSIASVAKPEVQKRLAAEVQAQYNAGQLMLDGVGPEIDVTAVVASTTALVIDQTSSIPRIVVVPRGEVRSGFHDFALDLAALRYQPVSEALWIQHLGTGHGEAVGLGSGGIFEARLEDYVVSGLIDFDDVSYDDNAAVLYSLAGQVAKHFLSYLSEEDAHRVLRVYQRDIANFVHTQMQVHYWEDAVEYDVKVNSGFSDIRVSAFTQTSPMVNFRVSPADKSNMGALLFDGFQRCLFPVQKFQSDAERTLAVILDRDAQKWFKPALGQFQIHYRDGHHFRDYQPDFVAELDDRIVMLEPKAHNQMDDPLVLAKRAAAVEWCNHASDHAATSGGKPWQYALIPHDAIHENWDITKLLAHWTA